MIVNDKDLKITSGEVEIRNIDYNGVSVQRYDCGKCGVALWFSSDGYPGLAALKPGTFDETNWFKPIAHLWVRSAQDWVILDDATAKYEKQPEISELIQLWSDRGNA